jgi:hypothetical protein
MTIRYVYRQLVSARPRSSTPTMTRPGRKRERFCRRSRPPAVASDTASVYGDAETVVPVSKHKNRELSGVRLR